LLDAGKANDLAAANKVLCKADVAAGTAEDLGSGGRVLSYTIGKTTKMDSSHAAVQVKVTTASGSSSAPVPVVKENGSWKVCFTSAPNPSASGSPGAPSTAAPSGIIPLPSVSVPSIAIPSLSVPSVGSLPGINICSGASSAQQAAQVYVSAATIGQTDLAQACVYHDSVSRSVTESIHSAGEFYRLSGQKSATTFEFRSVTSSSIITVTVTRESDGKYWITDVKKG
jgi:hypothetical protein